MAAPAAEEKTTMQVLRLLSVLVIGALVSACATAPDPLACAAVGAALGGGGGAYAGTETPGHDGDEIAAYGAAGLLVGGGAGYLLCKLLAEEEAPPPAPVVKPAPAPRPAPTVDRCAEVIRLRGVNFDFDRAEIRPDAAVILDEAASLLQDALRDCPSRSVSVDGYTDAVGADAYNQGLSERRANSVMDYLAGQGVSSSRLSAKGFGESSPIATNETAEGRALNRRVELRLQ
jgi:outer membrane protein OmpA-like peptidoglycan-associated protein